MKVSEMFNIKEKYSKTHYNCKHSKARETDSERERLKNVRHTYMGSFLSSLAGWLAGLLSFFNSKR